MTVTRFQATPCPICGYQLDAASPVGDADATPDPGDVTICFECTTVLVFTAFRTVRLPTPEESVMAYADDTVTRARAGIAAFRKGEQLDKIRRTILSWSLEEEEFPVVFTIVDRGTSKVLWQETVSDFGALEIPGGWPRPVQITAEFATGRVQEVA